MFNFLKKKKYYNVYFMCNGIPNAVTVQATDQQDAMKRVIRKYTSNFVVIMKVQELLK